MDYILAFVIGGIICVLSQILMDTTKLMPGRVMVILVCTGVILGAIGVYEPFLKFAGAGAFVPLTGFGYNLAKGVIEEVDSSGFLGIFTGGLKAAAGGISGAVAFSWLAAVFFDPKGK